MKFYFFLPKDSIYDEDWFKDEEEEEEGREGDKEEEKKEESKRKRKEEKQLVCELLEGTERKMCNREWM